MKKPFTNRILGVNIAITNMQETVNLIIEHLEEIRGQFICLSNVHTTVMSEKGCRISRDTEFCFFGIAGWKPVGTGSKAQRIP